MKNKGEVFKSMDDKLYLIRCPECGLENYAANVSLGICTWCGYKATEDDVLNKLNTEGN